ncbi:MAG: carboxymuconolactone decarboxylase family protein [Serratia sp. (in: enterobacteria)]|uniref:carboxymuconolactone decarboxylase family protein n=1 Tax=Serratia sp. (in: enterobacteria) TaxID=616 RepID=UPI003F3FA4D3
MIMKNTLFYKGLIFSGLIFAAFAWSTEPESRRSLGEETLAKITGEEGKRVVESLRDISPELGDWIIDFSYGDVFSRSGVSLCTRELATISALTALGNAQPQLKVHIEGALNVGCKPDEIVEIINQMAVYAGFPSALNGIGAAREVFDKRGVKPRL